MEASPSPVYGARLLSGFGAKTPSRVQIPPPPPELSAPSVAGGPRGGAWAVQDEASGEVGRLPPHGGEGVSRRDEQRRVGTRDEFRVGASQDGRETTARVGVQFHTCRERNLQAVQHAEGVPRDSRFDETIPSQRSEPRRGDGMIFDVDHSCRGGQHVAT